MVDVEGGDRIAAPGQCHGTPLLLPSAYSPTRANWCLVATRCTPGSTGLTRLGRAEQTLRENARACNLSLDHRQCQAAPANQHLDHAMAAPFGRLRFLGGQPLLRHAELDGLHGAGQMPASRLPTPCLCASGNSACQRPGPPYPASQFDQRASRLADQHFHPAAGAQAARLGRHRVEGLLRLVEQGRKLLPAGAAHRLELRLCTP